MKRLNRSRHRVVRGAVAEALERRCLMTAIASDQTIAGDIAFVGEADEYTFDANPGNTIMVALGETAGGTPFVPQVDIFAPDGTRVGGNFGGTGLHAEVTAAQSGTYRAVVTSRFNTATGSYEITLGKLPGPQTAGPDGGTIFSGQRLAGSVPLGDLDIFRFLADGGDTVILALGETAGGAAFVPQVDVYGPTGARVTGTFGTGGLNLEFTAASGGTYYAVVRSRFGDAPGDYRLSMVKVPGTLMDDAFDEDGGPILSGQRLAGTIDLGDVDAFTFQAGAGDSILLGLGETAGGNAFVPRLDLYGPNGVRLGGTFAADGLHQDFTAPSAGTYHAVVRDRFSEAAGAYRLSLLTFPAAQSDDAFDNDGGPILSGQRLPGTIDLGDSDAFTFAANAGSRILVSLGETDPGTGFVPRLDVYGPNGALLGGTFDAVGMHLEFAAATAGTYYAVVRDRFGSATGAYRVSLLVVPAVQADDAFDNDGGPILGGQRLAGTIDVGDLDAFTFAASGGDRFIVGLGETSGGNAFVPRLDVYGPNGALLGGTFDATGMNLEFVAPSGGTYYAVVRDRFGQNVGQYRVTLLTLPGPIADDAFDEDGGAVQSGRSARGTIDVGDLDAFTFQAVAGDVLLWNLGEWAGGTGFVPQLDVYGPTGALIAGTFDGVGLSLSTPAAVAGTYTAVVRSRFSQAAGEYQLSLIRVPGAQTADPLDPNGGVLASGTPLAGSITSGDLDVFTFQGTAGVAFTVNVADTFGGTPFVPQVRVYGPTGTLVGQAANGTLATVTIANPAATGTYYAVVGEQNGDAVGSYTIALNAAAGADTVAPRLLEAWSEDERRQAVNFRIDESITGLSVTDLTLVNLDTGLPVDPFAIQADFNPLNNVVTFTFPGFPAGMLPAGRYAATLGPGGLQDAGGLGLANTMTVQFTSLPGDVNRDGIVNLGDVNYVVARWLTNPATLSLGDANHDGVTDLGDINFIISNWLTTLLA